MILYGTEDATGVGLRVERGTKREKDENEKQAKRFHGMPP